MRVSRTLARRRDTVALSAAMLLALLLSACSDSAPPAPTAPATGLALLAIQGAEPRRTDTPWQRMTDSELTEQVGRAEGRVFIGFKDEDAAAGVDPAGRVLASESAVVQGKEAARAMGIEFEFEFLDMPTVVGRMSAARLPELRRNPFIEYVEPIFPGERHAQTIPWNVHRVGAPTAWSSSTGSGAKLLIIDSGIQSTHPDLDPAVVQSCESPPGSGLDGFGHGTQVAGVAAALDNTIQIVGVVPDVSVWTSKDGDSAPDPAYTACGVQFGRTNSVHAINISSSFSPYTALTDQINAAYNQNGIVMVAAAGNTYHGAVTYPATLSAVIAVSATDSNNALAYFSAVGSKVELAASGADITTTCLGNTTCTVSGTSFASPHVAGAAALLKSYDSTWSNIEVRRRLGAGATDLGVPGRDPQFGFGLLNIPGALAADPPPPLSFVSIDGPTLIKPGATCTWYADVGGGTTPYSYQWTNDGQPGGSDYYYTGSRGAGSTTSWFKIKLVVTDALGSTGNHEITVHEDSSAPICFL